MVPMATLSDMSNLEVSQNGFDASKVQKGVSQSVQIYTRDEFEKMRQSTDPATNRYLSMQKALNNSGNYPIYTDEETGVKYYLKNPACFLLGGGAGTSREVDEGETKQMGGLDRLETRLAWHKKNYGTGVSSGLIIYNATGKNMEKFSSNNFLNSECIEEPRSSIAAGERVCGFYRKANAEARGSSGYAAYRVENASGHNYIAVIGFYNSWATDFQTPARHVFMDLCPDNTITTGLSVDKIISNGSTSVQALNNVASSGISLHAEIGGGDRFNPIYYCSINAAPTSSSSS